MTNKFTPEQLRDNFLLQAFNSFASAQTVNGGFIWIERCKALPRELEELWEHLYYAVVNANTEGEGGAWAVQAEIEGLYARVRELENELSDHRCRVMPVPVVIE